MNSLQRRGLVNASVAAVATFAIGSAVVYAAGGPEDVATPPPSTSPSASPTTRSCTPTWDVVRSANPGEAATTLLGVTAVTSAEAWAVGGLGQPEIPPAVAIHRWDGDRWGAVAGPSPGTTLNELRAVDASEPNDVWAVGSVGDPAASLERALVLHWDGTAWTDVGIGRATGGGKSALVDIEGVSPTDLWTVGYQHFRPLILRFDGEAWSRSPTEIRGTLHAIEASATSEVWAVGTPIQRFDGETWAETPIRRGDAELVAVAAIGGLDIWAVGSRPSREPGTTRAAVYRYSDRRWVPVGGPSVGGSDSLSAVDALPDGTLLAVGWRDVGPERQTLAIRGTTCPPAT